MSRSQLVFTYQILIILTATNPPCCIRPSLMRLQIFGSISSCYEDHLIQMSYCSKGQRHKFISAEHLTTEQHQKKQRELIKAEDSIISMKTNDDQSLASSILSFPHFGSPEGGLPAGFPRNRDEKRNIIARYSDRELFYIRKKDLYDTLRDRYDPEHAESPLDPLYSFGALCKRESLLFDPDVRATLDEIWFITDADNSGSVDYPEYEKMHESMSIAVYGPAYLKKPEKIRRKLCLQDWNLDRDGANSLDYSRFTMCWFQLADQFTERIVAKDYVDYLRSMFFKMVEVDAVTGKAKYKAERVIAGLEKSANKEYTMEIKPDATKMKAQRRKTDRMLRRSKEVGELGAAREVLIEMEEKEFKEKEFKEKEFKEKELQRETTERTSMKGADMESAAANALLAVAQLDEMPDLPPEKEGGELVPNMMFDNIMDMYMDRSSFARHMRTSGETKFDQKQSLIREGHIGDDEYEDEEARHRALMRKTMMAKQLAEAACEVQNEEESLDASSIGMASLASIHTTESERQRRIKEQDAIVKARESYEMFHEETLTREIMANEKKVEEVKRQMEEKEHLDRAKQAYQEAMERNEMMAVERQQRAVERKAKLEEKQLQVVEEAKKALEAMETKALEKYKRKLERKRRKRRPMEGHIMVWGSFMDTGPGKPPHHNPDDLNELMTRRIKVKEKETIDWVRMKEKLRESRKGAISETIFKRSLKTTMDITAMKIEQKNEVLKGLEKKEMLNWTWSKGTSHLCWSSTDCTSIPHERSESILGGDLDKWWGVNDAAFSPPTPFRVGRPVTPIIWKSAKRREPLIVEDGWVASVDNQAPASDEQMNSPVKTNKTRTKEVRPHTASARLAASVVVKELAPFKGDPIPVSKRMDFAIRKRLMNEKVIESKRALSASKGRQYLIEVKPEDHIESSMERIDVDAPLFYSQQLSDKRMWSPQMKSRMSRIFKTKAAKEPTMALLNSRSPGKLARALKFGSRPQTSAGRLASQAAKGMPTTCVGDVSGSGMGEIIAMAEAKMMSRDGAAREDEMPQPNGSMHESTSITVNPMSEIKAMRSVESLADMSFGSSHVLFVDAKAEHAASALP